jgi:Pol polyprotein
MKDKPDIEAWAAIDGGEEDDTTLHILIMAIESGVKVQTELFDLGASCHMFPNHKQFVTYHEIPAHPITAANNKVFHAIGMGDLQIKVPNGKGLTDVLLKDVLHAPNLALIVILIGHITKAGYTVQFAEDLCTIKKGDDGPIIGQFPAGMNGLFKVKHAFMVNTSVKPIDVFMLHYRLSHISVNAICTLICTSSFTGLQLIDDLPPFTYDSCKYAKTACKPIQKE